MANKKFILIKNILLSNFKRLAFPYKVTFALTYRCNLRCKICRIWESQNKEELSIREIEKTFKRLKSLCWLDLTGGEVTLREDLIEIIKVIIKSAKRVSIFHISTNGQLVDKIFLLAKEILKFSVIPIINISIDGPKEINDRLKGVEGAYSRSLEAFKLLKRLNKGYYYLSCTISNFNIEYIDEFLLGLKKDMPGFSLSDLHFNIFHNSSHYYKNQNVEGSSKWKFNDIRRYFKISKESNFIKKFLEARYIKGLFGYLNGNRFPVKCQALKSSCFINPHGEIYPCIHYDRFIANLKDYNYNLIKILNSSNIFKTREDIDNGLCSGCWSPCEAYPAILANLIGLI